MCNFEYVKLSNFMDSKQLISRALKKEFLSADEGQFLYENTPTADLMFIANELRQIQVPGNKVTWQIDRNVNTTNACNANCKFCNFFHKRHCYSKSKENIKKELNKLISKYKNPISDKKIRQVVSTNNCITDGFCYALATGTFNTKNVNKKQLKGVSQQLARKSHMNTE